jgi:hypothetical protein
VQEGIAGTERDRDKTGDHHVITVHGGWDKETAEDVEEEPLLYVS